MAKLYFRYGTVCSAKSAELINVASNYKYQKKNVIIFQSEINIRDKEGHVCSRTGQEFPCYTVSDNTDLFHVIANELKDLDQISCVLVDEVHMLTVEHVEQLRKISIAFKIPVIAYGLLRSFKSTLFESSKRMTELADKIEEIKTTCFYCNKKATQNLKLVNGKPIYSGNDLEVGGLELYHPVCIEHFYKPPV